MSLRLYSDCTAKLLCLIKQFAIFTCALQTYFLRTRSVIGCVYFHTPWQTEPNRSPPSKSVTHIFLHGKENLESGGEHFYPNLTAVGEWQNINNINIRKRKRNTTSTIPLTPPPPPSPSPKKE